MTTSLSHKYYRTIGQPWLVISIQTGSDAVARAMMSGNNALDPKWRPTAAQASSWLQETVFHLYVKRLAYTAASTVKYCTQQK
jgi:hypothetical protein